MYKYWAESLSLYGKIASKFLFLLPSLCIYCNTKMICPTCRDRDLGFFNYYIYTMNVRYHRTNIHSNCCQVTKTTINALAAMPPRASPKLCRDCLSLSPPLSTLRTRRQCRERKEEGFL